MGLQPPAPGVSCREAVGLAAAPVALVLAAPAPLDCVSNVMHSLRAA
jgi:hypothetical protein